MTNGNMSTKSFYMRLFHGLLVLGSFGSVILVMYFDISGALSISRTLFGYDNNKIGSYQYDSPTIPRYLKIQVENRESQLLEMQTALYYDQRIMYIEPDPIDPTEYIIEFGNCTSLGGYLESDRLYKDWYMIPLLQRILNGMNSSIDLSAYPITHMIMIDCDYSGRHFQDTSMFKAFVVDIDMITMTSFAIQTMNAHRESTQMEVQVGPVIVSSADIQSFLLGPEDPPNKPMYYGLKYTGKTVYRTLIAFDFPYEENSPFQETIHVGILPTNQWNWRVKSTGETLTINGFSGYYRGSKNEQANFLRYIIAMTGNPIRDFTVDFYSSLGHTKDSWAWIQGLIILTVGMRIGLSVIVALCVSIFTFIHHRQVWLPDVFATCKRHIRLRSILILIAFVLDRFWSIHEWIITTVYLRYNLLPMFMLGSSVRSDLLTLFIIWTDVIATLLRVSIPPVIPIVIYTLSYINSEYIVQILPSTSNEQGVSTYINELYVRHLVSYSSTGMNLWTRYKLEENDPPIWLVLRELTWFLAPCLGIILLLLVYKIFLYILNRFSRQNKEIKPAEGNFSIPATAMASIDSVPFTFFDNFLPDAKGVPTRGLVTHPPPLYYFEKDEFQVDKSILWCAGWVLLGGKYLINIDDIPNVFLNVISQASVVKIYCCRVFPTRNDRLFLSTNLETLPTWDLSIRDIFDLTLETMWVHRVMPDANTKHIRISTTSSVTKQKVVTAISHAKSVGPTTAITLEGVVPR